MKYFCWCAQWTGKEGYRVVTTWAGKPVTSERQAKIHAKRMRARFLLEELPDATGAKEIYHCMADDPDRRGRWVAAFGKIIPAADLVLTGLGAPHVP